MWLISSVGFEKHQWSRHPESSSINFLYLFDSVPHHGVLVTIFSGHWWRGGVHGGHITGMSQGYMKTNKTTTHAHSHLEPKDETLEKVLKKHTFLGAVLSRKQSNRLGFGGEVCVPHFFPKPFLICSKNLGKINQKDVYTSSRFLKVCDKRGYICCTK